jgi:hypothetical protein
VERKDGLAGILVACGTASFLVAVIAGTGLDSMYILWSALTFADRRLELMMGGAPYSIMSPLLIWSAAAMGVLFVGLGLRIGLHHPQTAPPSDAGNGQRMNDVQTVEDTLRAWQKGRR